jgi:hypothetical protein
MNDVIIAVIQAALELTTKSLSVTRPMHESRQTDDVDKHFVIHYAAIIKAINENPIGQPHEAIAPPLAQGKARTH